MKFKGFWKATWELTKHSLRWLKDYWFLYIVLSILLAFMYFIPSVIDAIARTYKPSDELENEDEEFFK